MKSSGTVWAFRHDMHSRIHGFNERQAWFITYIALKQCRIECVESLSSIECIVQGMNDIRIYIRITSTNGIPNHGNISDCVTQI